MPYIPTFSQALVRTQIFALPSIRSHSWSVFQNTTVCFGVFGTGLALVASLLRILYFDHELQQGAHQESEHELTDGKTDRERDVQLQVLTELGAELLSTLLKDLSMVSCSECMVRLQTSNHLHACFVILHKE